MLDKYMLFPVLSTLTIKVWCVSLLHMSFFDWTDYSRAALTLQASLLPPGPIGSQLMTYSPYPSSLPSCPHQCILSGLHRGHPAPNLSRFSHFLERLSVSQREDFPLTLRTPSLGQSLGVLTSGSVITNYSVEACPFNFGHLFDSCMCPFYQHIIYPYKYGPQIAE